MQVSYNPFDYVNAVTDPTLFVGREKELGDIDYYLRHAEKAPRPFNLAIIGARASGKTSLLNMIAHRARAFNLCVAQLELDEGDAVSALRLFFKMLDAIINAAVEFSRADGSHPFGGVQGLIFEKYLELVNAFLVPEPLWRTFTFPITYAQAMSSGRHDVNISEAAFKRDLQRIGAEVQAPIVLLMDECNVLSEQRVLLEKLRNVFMNTPGYMLVLTGTEDLFPIVNDVFSPFARQFKRIEVKPFETAEETGQLIERGFDSIGIELNAEAAPRLDRTVSHEIHSASGGKPHEIQLLCHCLTRQLEDGKTANMALSVELMDEVLEELQRGVDLARYPVIGKIRALDDAKLRSLAMRPRANGCDDRSYLRHPACLKGETDLSLESIQDAVNGLVAEGILTMVGPTIRFAGDDFEKIYIKYYARKRKIDFAAFPGSTAFRSAFDDFLRKHNLDYFAEAKLYAIPS